MAINVYYVVSELQQHNGGLPPEIILLTQGYYNRGTRLNALYQVEVLSLQPMKQYIITTLLLHCSWFCCFSGVPAWRLMSEYYIPGTV